MQLLKRAVRSMLGLLGYEIRKIHKIHPYRPGVNAFRDMARIQAGVPQPVVFDIGANVGQTVEHLRSEFPQAMIHSFEPSPKTFEALKANCGTMPNVQLWNLGLGAKSGTLPFLENSSSSMSSFLPIGSEGWGDRTQVTEVPVMALDDFTAEHKIERIHVLKSDAQGYDLQVFQGAERLFREGRVDLLMYEVILTKMYEGLPPYCGVLSYLYDRGFVPIGIYNQMYYYDRLGWFDMLFAAKHLAAARGG